MHACSVEISMLLSGFCLDSILSLYASNIPSIVVMIQWIHGLCGSILRPRHEDSSWYA